jgi:hypothetical protein
MSTSTPTHTAFEGFRRLARGPLPQVALAVKRALERRTNDAVLLFDDRTGRSIDIDIRGSDEELVARLTPVAVPAEASTDEAPESPEPRGRGRPKLGVVAREVTLLPRHWDWLSAQPGGASVALRKLVEEARRAGAGKERQRQANERTYHFMSAIGGDLPGFEEACRALFANDRAKFTRLLDAWPQDVREHALLLAHGDEPADEAARD